MNEPINVLTLGHFLQANLQYNWSDYEKLKKLLSLRYQFEILKKSRVYIYQAYWGLIDT